ncbi:protein of unknown function [Acidithiobacillus ferrivorans]|uniref:Uncharacterized protein n=1 Tax=Acidithiobacillus ferrivorans TaxID=160808 RepID=A0A060URK1_9PROT|nr:hypothetical protein AFERRI_30064 [Acidithiobacillus ferrivorans]SMH66352.1 protein of unknown function [Acidithiobacillus ferrivorans]
MSFKKSISYFNRFFNIMVPYMVIMYGDKVTTNKEIKQEASTNCNENNTHSISPFIQPNVKLRGAALLRPSSTPG